MPPIPLFPAALLLAVSLGATGPVAPPEPADPPPLDWFFQAASSNSREAEIALDRLAEVWRDDYAILIVDIARFFPASSSRRGGTGAFFEGAGQGEGVTGGFRGGSPVRRRLVRFLERTTGKRFGEDLDRWRKWIWSRDYGPHPDYGQFKGAIYGNIDPRMEEFFPTGVAATIRLDQVDWGGVAVDGIPPLVDPQVVPARRATYLSDRDVVFGLVAGGEARAYPKRILAWHELARDEVGGVAITLVYCTLCGTVIPYDSEVEGRRLSFGTSGLLYRSNKLMYDRETRSLWSSLTGEPVIGPLAGSGFSLSRLPVVTTTWGEWRRLHPSTVVLSLATGFDRDYSEGAAYRDYFRTDRLMFEVSEVDRRLKNKAEVLAIPSIGRDRDRPLAIAVSFLRKRPVFLLERDELRFVVLTSERGAHRVYRVNGPAPDRWLEGETVSDGSGHHWRVTEEALIPEFDGTSIPRIPAHRVFWFGWFAQHPDTELIQDEE